MYLPAAFSVEDLQAWHNLINDNPLATVIAIPHLEISNIPLFLEHENEKIYLRGHLARANPLYKLLTQENLKLLCIFNGPHGYISPKYYLGDNFNVPTWNYAIVHVSGQASLTDTDRLIKILDKSIDKFESGSENAWSIDWNNPLAEKKLSGIAGFEIEISHIQGKFKLSQNRTTEEKSGVIASLSKSSHPEERILATFMEQINNGTT